MDRKDTSFGDLSALFKETGHENGAMKSGPRYTHPPEHLRSDWQEGFSNPRQTSDKYRYLLHGVDPMRHSSQMLVILKDHSQYDASQDVDLMVNPHDISQKLVISASVIDQDKRGTFGDVGFILKAPFDNVLEMSPQDLGTNFARPADVLEHNLQSRQIVPLDQMLLQTSRFEWNEVRLTGKTGAGHVEVVGCFIKVDKQGMALNPEMARQISYLAAMYDLPVVEIDKPTFDFQNSPAGLHRFLDYEPPFGVGYIRDECSYSVRFNDEKMPFIVANGEGKAREMIQSEAVNAIRIIEQELSKAELGEILGQLEAVKLRIPELSTILPETEPTPVDDNPYDSGGYSEGSKLSIKKPDTGIFTVFKAKFDM